MKRNIVIWIISLASICLVLFFYSTSAHWWVRTDDVRIYLDGKSMNELEAFRGPTGEILIRLTKVDDHYTDYVYFPDLKEVGVLSTSSQFVYFWRIALCKDITPGVVMLSDRIKVETDKNVVIEASFVEFTTFEAGRVRVEF